MGFTVGLGSAGTCAGETGAAEESEAGATFAAWVPGRSAGSSMIGMISGFAPRSGSRSGFAD